MKTRTQRIYPDLTTYFRESGDSQRAFAQRYARSQSWVSKVVNGDLEPGIRLALRISHDTGVPLESMAVRGAVVSRS